VPFSGAEIAHCLDTTRLKFCVRGQLIERGVATTVFDISCWLSGSGSSASADTNSSLSASLRGYRAHWDILFEVDGSTDYWLVSRDISLHWPMDAHRGCFDRRNRIVDFTDSHRRSMDPQNTIAVELWIIKLAPLETPSSLSATIRVAVTTHGYQRALA
jgi:hypothetical protein